MKKIYIIINNIIIKFKTKAMLLTEYWKLLFNILFLAINNCKTVRFNIKKNINL